MARAPSAHRTVRPVGPRRPGEAALVVTLALDASAQQRFDALRRDHFPADRLQVGAHVTLFHALPGEHRATVRHDLHALAGPPFAVRVVRVRSLGRGVAYDLHAPELDRLHAELARRWAPWLTRQDAQPLRAHVTVQNKVGPETARALLAELSAVFVPYDVQAVGLQLWRYLGGPWEAVETVPLAPSGVERLDRS